MIGQKQLPFADWPEQDRLAWERAIADGDIFDGRGPAAHWRPESRRSVLRGYRRWLGHLAATDPAALALRPAERVTLERVNAYIAVLNASITPAGTHNYVKFLYDAMRVMAPAQDWLWLRELARRIARNIKRPSKWPRMVAAERLLDLAIGLMERTEAAENGGTGGQLTPPGSPERALLFRDGLIVGVLTLTGLRRRNIAGIRIGEQLKRVGTGHVLVFRAAEMKDHRPLEMPVPDVLAPYLDRYLTVHRPLIRGAMTHDGLWASMKGRPMSQEAIYERFREHTRVAFGRAINPHLVRAIAPTFISIEDPSHIGIATDLLGHSRPETTERYYRQSNTIKAVRAHRPGCSPAGMARGAGTGASANTREAVSEGEASCARRNLHPVFE